MEPNGLHGGLLFSGIGSGMLGLEMPLHPQPQQQNPQNPQNQQNPLHLNHHPQMVAYAHHPETDHHPHQSVKQQPGYSFASKTKQQLSPLSDEDELAFAPDDNTGGDGKRKVSPWQRMKWTDGMVRLLIMAVFYIGDEAGSDGGDKKKVGALLQKKGKWKSVSRAMMEKGFYVSPQQCEDKFNDLNKRYKRVNEILGKGTACRVVENQSLLDTMDLSPKMKEEVKKLLNSKHLFFREMCAYHNSCGHGTGGTTTGASHSPEVAVEPSQAQHQQAAQQQQQRCSHSSENVNVHTGTNSSRKESERSKIVRLGSEEEDDVEDDDSDDSDDEFDDDEGHSRGQNEEDDNNNNDERQPHKRQRKEGIFTGVLSPMMQQLSSDVSAMIQDGAKNSWEKKQWIKMKLHQLEEQHVNYQYQAFELEKQRLKWVKFSSKKEREMERAKLQNDRKRLENERMVLVVKQKELELIDLHHHHQQQHSSTKRSDPSSITG